MMKLNLGSGDRKQEGWINLDRAGRPDVLFDLERMPLPFPDGSMEKVLASHVLEHIVKLVELVNDVHRVLAAGGEFLVAVPEFPTISAVKDPGHVRFFVEETFTQYFGHGAELGYDNPFLPWKVKDIKTHRQGREGVIVAIMVK